MIFHIGRWSRDLLIECIITTIVDKHIQTAIGEPASRPFHGAPEVAAAFEELTDLVRFQNETMARANAAIKDSTVIGAVRNRHAADKLKAAHAVNPNAVPIATLAKFEAQVPKQVRGRPPNIHPLSNLPPTDQLRRPHRLHRPRRRHPPPPSHTIFPRPDTPHNFSSPGRAKCTTSSSLVNIVGGRQCSAETATPYGFKQSPGHTAPPRLTALPNVTGPPFSDQWLGGGAPGTSVAPRTFVEDVKLAPGRGQSNWARAAGSGMAAGVFGRGTSVEDGQIGRSGAGAGGFGEGSQIGRELPVPGWGGRLASLDAALRRGRGIWARADGSRHVLRGQSNGARAAGFGEDGWSRRV